MDLVLDIAVNSRQWTHTHIYIADRVNIGMCV